MKSEGRESKRERERERKRCDDVVHLATVSGQSRARLWTTRNAASTRSMLLDTHALVVRLVQGVLALTL